MPQVLRAYDAMHYADQPDLRAGAAAGRIMQPLYMVYDGVVNQATHPERYNGGYGATHARFAIERCVRDALGIEHPGIQIARYNRPPEYDAVRQPLVLDFETHELMGMLYTEEPDSPRQRAAGMWLADLVDAAHLQANLYGTTCSFGSFCPLLPYAQDPAANMSAEMAFAPFLQRLDVAYPDCYIHGNLRDWKANVRAGLRRVRTLMPGKPIAPFVAPHFADRAVPAIRWKLLPQASWRDALRWLAEELKDDAEGSGIAMFGGPVFAQEDSRLRVPWKTVETHYRILMDVVSAANDK